ncbi:MAG TPA: hypothetical protein VIH57_26205 [Bacteroidales bacterium]
MQILSISIFYILWTFSLLGYGTLLKLFDKSINYSFIPKELLIALFGIMGIIIVTQLGVLCNFFVPLNQLFSLLVLVGGLLLFAFNGHFLVRSFSRSDYVIILLLFVYYSIFPHYFCDNLDPVIYHVTSIRWSNESAVPLGLANLHGRLGFNSSWFVSDAIIRPFAFLNGTRIFILNAILSFFFSTLVFLTFKSKLFQRRSIAENFMLLCIVPLCFYLYNNSDPSPDGANLLLNLLMVILLIYSIADIKMYNFFIFCAFCIATFLVTIKLSSMIMLLCMGMLFLYLIYVKLRKVSSKFTDLTNISSRTLWITSLLCGFIILIPWLIKGVMLSGCLFYPSHIGYFNKLSWAVDPDQLLTEFKVTIAHSRLENEFCMNLPTPFAWLLPWLQSFVINNFFLAISVVLVLFLGFKYRKVIFSDPKINFIFISSFLSIVYWFCTAPLPRYGYGALFTNVLLFFSIFLHAGFRSEPLFKFSRDIRKLVLKLGITLTVLSITLLFIPITSWLIEAAETLRQRQINHDLWRSVINQYRAVVFIIGAAMVLTGFVKVISRTAILTAIILGMIAFNFTRTLPEYSNPCKLGKIMASNHFTVKPYRTSQNFVVYSNPEPVLPAKINRNDSAFLDKDPKSEYAECDVPLLFSPYFYPSIKIDLKNGKRYIFRTSEEFSRIEKFSFMFGINPPAFKSR